MKNLDRERFRLTVRAEPGPPPAVIRLRHLLKRLLRGYGFRAEKVEQLSAVEEPPATVAVIEAAGQLDPDWREFFEERAGIMQYDGGLSREDAERLALVDTLEVMKRTDGGAT